MKKNNYDKPKDTFLEDRINNVDRWLQEGKIPFSSKVIPINEAFEAKQWVLPTEQVLEILRNARSFALKNCGCRSHFQRCDNPVDVCLVINDFADKCVSDGIARVVSIEDAKNVLRQANERGLVHLTIYNPEQYVYAVCSCCTCCCHDLQALKLYGRSDLIAHSDYIAQTNIDICINCGSCINRCVFGARVWKDESLEFNSKECYGCGLCVTVCPEKAIVMQRR